MWALNLKPVSELYPGKQDVPVQAVITADIITFMPTYDFFAPIRPVPQQGPDGKTVMGMARDPLITGRDFTYKPYKTHIRNGPGVMFDFLSQMAPDDRKTYVGFIDQARAFMKNKNDIAKDGPRVALANDTEVDAIARSHGRRS